MGTAGELPAVQIGGAGGGTSIRAVPTLGEEIRQQLAALSRLNAPTNLTATRVRRVFNLLTEGSLDRPAAPPFAGLSSINSDGLPFQWVFRVDGGPLGWGFLCEGGRPGMSVPARYALTRQRIGAACAAIGDVPPTFLDSIAGRLMPTGDDPWPANWRSAIWVGVAIRNEILQIKPYFNLSRGSPRERWLRAGWLLKDLGRMSALGRLCALSSHCSEGSWPVGLAVDIHPGGLAGRIKIYFRSSAVTPAWLQRWYEALGLNAHASSVRRLLDLLGRVGSRPYPQSSFVISLEIHPDERMSLKTDVAMTKWMSSDAQIVEAAMALVGAFGQHPKTLTESLRAIGAWPPDDPYAPTEMRFVGLGCEPDGSQHLNVYVAPPLRKRTEHERCKTPDRNKLIRNSVACGLSYLSDSCQDGHWEDFSLPVGTSDAWVTGYVLTNIGEIPQRLLRPILKSLSGPLDWLTSARTVGGGWGYRRGVPDDADSTAWAILAMRAFRRPVPRDALALLKACTLDDGSVATYPPRTSPAPGWARASPDVTAVALRVVPTSQRPAARDCLWRWARADGLIPAYWWASPLYTCAMLADGERTSHPQLASLRLTISKFQTAGSFERAHLLRCRMGLGLSSCALAHELAEQQGGNGAWPPSALLRLTRPEVDRPWSAIDAGPLYVDEHAIFTTVTATAALARFLAKSQQ